MSTPDPALVAEVSGHARVRTAHHEAGHAVAAVVRGGTLTRVHLGHADWSTFDTSGDRPGDTHHRTVPANAPFVTFAGPWATAMWTVENDPEVEEFDEALEFAWAEAGDGDGAKYDGIVDQLAGVAEVIGLPLYGTRPWEYDWLQELEPLWPAVCQVAGLLIDGQTVDHADVQAAIDRLAAPTD